MSTEENMMQITEDEAAVYDRQIRLWGLEAQQRMRNASILVLRLKGTATEVVKNIVLAGIGKLIIADGEDIAEEDLGAGFFYRDQDLGKKRVDAAKARIQSLNPLVIVECIPRLDLSEQEELDNLVRAADLVCMTDLSRNDIIRVNESCRRLSKPFYTGGTFGIFGYIFCDLLEHDYIAPDRAAAQQDVVKNIKSTAKYCPLPVALGHRWTGMTKRQTKEWNPAVVFSILALWEYENIHGSLPDDPSAIGELEATANKLLVAADVNKQVATAVPRDLIAPMATTAVHEFSPVCAVVGGMLAQDILKALAAREPPIANFLAFNGNTGGASVCRWM